MALGLERVGEEVQKAISFKTGPLLGLQNVHIDTVIWTWVAMVILIGFALVMRRRLLLVPEARGAQNFLEMTWEFFSNIAGDLLGNKANLYMPIIFTIFCFVLVGNLFGLLPSVTIAGIECPGPYTRDINTTVALAVFSVVAFNAFGIINKGFFGWLAHFPGPLKELWHSIEGPAKYIMVPFMGVLFLLINSIEQVARLVSLSMRLFGNIMGKHIVMAVLYGLAVFSPIILRPVVDTVPLFVWLIGLIASIVQALIFPLLTLAYIAGAVAEHH